MARVNVLVLRTAGINCDEETVHAWRLAGASAEKIHVDRLIESPTRLDAAQIFTLPGGFSYGDDIAAGKILAAQLVHHLLDALHRFVGSGKLVLGICNGFQALIKAGLLPGWPKDVQRVTLTFNDSSRFEARWVHLRVCTDRCCFLPSGTTLTLPVAHAEGKLVVDDPATLTALNDGGHVALRYVDAEGRPARYPGNPNGSVDGIAGLTDASGQVLGLMPHPERFVDPTQHPLWTRAHSAPDPDGLTVFRHAVGHFR